MNILITGATGFIGRYLVERLTKSQTHSLFCLIHKRRNQNILKCYGPEFIYGDIAAGESLRKILDYKIDVIFHCAGCFYNKGNNLLHKVNVIGTENICKLAMKLKVKRLVHLSSVAVVSGNSQIPLKEDLPFRASSIYGKSKIEAEKVVLKYRDKGLRAVILRPCMVYGKGASHITGKILAGLKYRVLPLIDKGKRKLHMVFVKNLVEAMVFSLSKDEFLKGSFFVADKDVLTVRELFIVFSKALNVKPPLSIPGFLNNFLLRFSFIGKKFSLFSKDRVYSIKRIELLGFCPPYSLKNNSCMPC